MEIWKREEPNLDKEIIIGINNLIIDEEHKYINSIDVEDWTRNIK